MLRADAIQKFLYSQPYEMGKLYNPSMEVQVNVFPGTGDLIEGDFQGRKWVGYTDGLQTWKSFRIPWNANSTPEYIDKPIGFDISKHAEAIGMTGWDWVNKQSLWVGYDFDSIVDHKGGLNEKELKDVFERLGQVRFVSIFTSSSGNGFHIYVSINVQNIQNHAVHTALARAILDKLSQHIDYKLEAKVDAVGGNMWVWHKKAGPQSFKCLKKGIPLTDIPENWQQYIPRTRRLIHHRQTNVDELAAANRLIGLDEEHLRLLKWFETSDGCWWWDEDKQMLVCHTYDLKIAHEKLGFKGFFDTVSEGREHGHDQNCFGFPINAGGWVFRRHTKGVGEHGSWSVGESGWTTCYYNTTPSVNTAVKASGGTEGEKEYYFTSTKTALEAIRMCGGNIKDIATPERPATLKDFYDGRILLSFKKHGDETIEGFQEKAGKWQKIFYRPLDPIDLPDHLFRNLVEGDASVGWYIKTISGWVRQERSNLISFLLGSGYKKGQLERVLGEAVYRNWNLVYYPFKPEYPGNRGWNRIAPQFACNAERGKFETWATVFKHCGRGLDATCKQDKWCKANGIRNGSAYLQAWVASCFQYPNEPTPYLFLYGPQNTGKSTFHEVLSLLVTKGVVKADQALVSKDGFNGELLRAIFCVIEEVNLGKGGPAYDRIKDWVTSITLSVHAKKQTPFDTANYTHWIQCANESNYCPVLPGDTRITMIYVDHPKEEIPKETLLKQCQVEAPAILWHLLNFKVPKTQGRLRIPVLETEEKKIEVQKNTDALTEFIETYIHNIPGSKVPLSDFYERFQFWLDPTERGEWTLRKVGKRVPFIKGKWGGQNQTFLANISFTNSEAKGFKLGVENGRLV